MSCRICGRNSCTESFHSLEEQEKYEEQNGKLVKKEEVKEEVDER
jgi:hypothetical protein